MITTLTDRTPFCEDLVGQFNHSLATALETEGKTRKLTAVFDADGTLWDTDIGESFFRFQIENKLSDYLTSDPWGYYEQLKDNGHQRTAYLWLAQICASHSLSAVRQQCLDHARSVPPAPVFKSMQWAIKRFMECGVDCFVVTASVKWPVEPFAMELGFAQDHVIGIETSTNSDGIVTMEQQGPISWREGKLEKFKLLAGGRNPDFAFGNTMGDSYLLEAAKYFKLAVSSVPKGHRIYHEEQELVKHAQLKNWAHHQF